MRRHEPSGVRLVHVLNMWATKKPKPLALTGRAQSTEQATAGSADVLMAVVATAADIERMGFHGSAPRHGNCAAKTSERIRAAIARWIGVAAKPRKGGKARDSFEIGDFDFVALYLVEPAIPLDFALRVPDATVFAGGHGSALHRSNADGVAGIEGPFLNGTDDGVADHGAFVLIRPDFDQAAVKFVAKITEQFDCEFHLSLHQRAASPNDETLAQASVCVNRISMIALIP
jgi:hypothetical protein